jgi:hypothetical protein
MNMPSIDDTKLEFRPFFLLMLISALTFSIASIWNTTILTTLNTLYPIHEDENTYKRILLQYVYAIGVTVLLGLLIRFFYKKL